ncbi:hypothetical protein [Microbacterium sp. 2FI]|uniref:hypothetical protein n=1 Tax=Microbacterium sp. 2FI TaxID=2502193 RepID=UPI0010F77F9D|nr:hypothetical protein [Microbacterium sp. 2FI]
MDRAAIEQAIELSRWREVVEWLGALDDAGLDEAKRWYRGTLRAAAQHVSERTWSESPRLVQLALALALSETPDEASRNGTWGRRFVWTDPEGGMPRLGALLGARDPAWASAFAALATATVLRGESARAAAEITAVTLPVYADGDAPIPTGTFALGWTQLVSMAAVASPPQNGDGRWIPLRIPRAGAAAHAYGVPTTLAEVLRATPRLDDMLAAALATPDALAEFSTMRGAGWDVGAAVKELVASGELDRERVVDGTLAALTRADRPTAQRAMAAILRGAAFGGADVRARLALVSHLMPSVHGSVTAVLLAAVLDAEPDEATLVDVGAVILARPEKAQKNLLVAWLSRRAETPGAQTLLAMAAGADDTAFAAKARAALDAPAAGEARGDAPDPGLPWALPVEGYRSHAAEPWSPDAAGMDAARSDEAVGVRVTTNALLLDQAVRFGYRDLSRLRDVVRSVASDSGMWWSSNRVLPMLRRWAEGGSTTRTRTHTTPPPAHELFTDRLVEETLSRLGELSELVSTPSRADGTVTLDDLADRLRRAGRAGVGPYELVQALLRLEPGAPRDAARFEGFSAPMWSGQVRRGWFDRRPPAMDAATVVRDWILAGGIPPRFAVIGPDSVRLAAVDLPLPTPLLALDGLAELCAASTLVEGGAVRYAQRPLGQADDVARYLGVVPWWTDAAAAQLEVAEGLESAFTAKALTFLTNAAGDPGPGAHRLLARSMSHPRPDSRLLAVEATAGFAAQGRLSASVLEDAATTALAEGALSLTRFADACDNGFRVGLLAWLWPAAWAVAGEALRRDRPPSGTADLLRALTRAVPVVRQHGEVPTTPELDRLAASRSSSKTAAEARALRAALGEGAS